jgi:hypothetical protein
MLSDICANSDADLTFDKMNFTITGSDDAVKSALTVISEMKMMTQVAYQIRVKIELANEHKEFVSGKKNGKINKIMGQSNVQIIFDGFNEYNFNIDVMGGSYESMKQGLTLVEQEMPASISFHVPDQYHKRIIGIGGQHIQRIMKKHSVFVKFSNAMDRGGMGREDDDIKVDNVICRTPARNAQNLDAVKNEILEMVDRAVSAPYHPKMDITNVFCRIRSTQRRVSALTGCITVSSLRDYLRLTIWSRSTTARSLSPAPSKPAMMSQSMDPSGRFPTV